MPPAPEVMKSPRSSPSASNSTTLLPVAEVTSRVPRGEIVIPRMLPMMEVSAPPIGAKIPWYCPLRSNACTTFSDWEETRKPSCAALRMMCVVVPRLSG